MTNTFDTIKNALYNSQLLPFNFQNFIKKNCKFQIKIFLSTRRYNYQFLFILRQLLACLICCEFLLYRGVFSTKGLNPLIHRLQIQSRNLFMFLTVREISPNMRIFLQMYEVLCFLQFFWHYSFFGFLSTSLLKLIVNSLYLNSVDQDLSLNRLHGILSLNLHFSFYQGGPNL